MCMISREWHWYMNYSVEATSSSVVFTCPDGSQHPVGRDGYPSWLRMGCFIRRRALLATVERGGRRDSGPAVRRIGRCSWAKAKDELIG